MEHNIDNLITDYLSDTLDFETRQDFERKMAASPELQARVAFEQELSEALHSESPENKLRAQLQLISQKFDPPEILRRSPGEASGGNARKWWLLAAGLLALVGLIYCYLGRPEKRTATPPPAQNLDQQTPAPTNNALKQTETPPSTPTNKPEPIAAAFKPIPKLEAYIGSQTRSNGFHFRIKEPQSGASLPLHSRFRLSGKIEGTLPANSSFKVLIFNNNQQDFENMKSVQSVGLELNPTGEFLFQKKLNWSPGLYYLVFEEQQSGEWVYVNNFLVK